MWIALPRAANAASRTASPVVGWAWIVAMSSSKVGLAADGQYSLGDEVCGSGAYYPETIIWKATATAFRTKRSC